VSNFDSI